MPEEKKLKDGKELELTEKVRKNPWIISTIVLGIFALVLLFFLFKGGVTGNVISEKEIGEKAVSFINSQLLQGQGEVTLDSVSVKNGLYEVMVDFNGKKVPTYFTKDGEYFVGTQVIPLTGQAITQDSGSEEPEKIVKSDKPKVELFVMTHCPYGTQAEKGVLPAVKALGDKIDFDVRFVHYFMHGDKEEQETYRQLCIREQQSAKFVSYLECFLEDGNSTRCLKNLGISENLCSENKSKEYYASDSEASKGYGVQGSPTLVINGVEANFYPRSPSSALNVICSAFNTIPEECSANLSTTNPSPGFGTAASASGSASNSASAGSCG